MIGTLASILSSTIVNVVIPDLNHHVHIGQERAIGIGLLHAGDDIVDPDNALAAAACCMRALPTAMAL